MPEENQENVTEGQREGGKQERSLSPHTHYNPSIPVTGGLEDFLGTSQLPLVHMYMHRVPEYL